MKIQDDHLNKMKDAINKINSEDAHNAYKAKGLSDMRYRWDLLHACQIEGLNGTAWLCKNLYPYANDDHIDTALRQITNTK